VQTANWQAASVPTASNVGQASRLSPSKNPPHLLGATSQATKPRLKAIIQSQRQARHFVRAVVVKLNVWFGNRGGQRTVRPTNRN